MYLHALEEVVVLLLTRRARLALRGTRVSTSAALAVAGHSAAVTTVITTVVATVVSTVVATVVATTSRKSSVDSGPGNPVVGVSAVDVEENSGVA